MFLSILVSIEVMITSVFAPISVLCCGSVEIANRAAVHCRELQKLQTRSQASVVCY